VEVEEDELEEVALPVVEDVVVVEEVELTDTGSENKFAKITSLLFWMPFEVLNV